MIASILNNLSSMLTQIDKIEAYDDGVRNGAAPFFSNFLQVKFTFSNIFST